jgi:rubredoxin-NAD+ reductase
MAQDPIIIIGSGLAGYTLARELRRLDAAIGLHIVTGDDGAYYSKPMLSNGISSGKRAAELVIQSAQAMRVQLSAAIDTHALADSIDLAARCVEVNGRRHPYSRLVLALGAQPIRLPLEGNAAHAVMSVNNLADYDLLQQRLAGKKRVVILGAGLIGCEFANDLCLAGLEVHLVDTGSMPLSRLVPAEVASVLRARLESDGVFFHTGVSCVSVDDHESGYRLRLSDDTLLDADLVLSAVGLRSDAALARAAGLKVARGIVVDQRLQTSDPFTYALGDCAEVCGLLLPYVMPIMHAAKALANTLTGKPTAVRYPAMPIVLKTPSLPLVVAPPGTTDGHWSFENLESGIKGLYQNSGSLLQGFALTGDAVSARRELAQNLPEWLPLEKASDVA